jgi:GNAT superfamily N-acetyltransferase
LLAELSGEIVGITGGLVYPLYFSPSHKVSQELWWWLTPAARGSGAGNKMFKHLQSWSKERGAETIFMIALEDERAQKMEKVYCRAGFEPLERTFMKRI